MRLDYHHSGIGGEEAFAIDSLRLEGPWPGSRVNLIDPLNLGPYRFEVRDAVSGHVLFSEGYSSIFSEWVTTAEAKTTRRSFHESLRFPFPRRPVQVNILKRGTDNLFREIATFPVDPSSKKVRGDPVTSSGRVWTLFENGPPENHVDLLILGDGYPASEMNTFHEDAERLVAVLFETSPFKELKTRFNVRAIDTPSEDSGVDRPSDGVFKRSALNVTYDIFGSERYALTLDNATLREAAAQAPYEFIEILINGEKYGGGGIYNLFATCVTRSGSSEYVFVHEFGHHFAALADEYYTSSVAYETTSPIIEPWEPNITAFLDPAALKWRDMVAEGTPLPTPWEKRAFDTHMAEVQKKRRELRAQHAPEPEIDKLFKEELDWSRPFLKSQKHSDGVGLFEGAGYRSQGLYRCSVDCIMFTRNPERFCPVCSRGIKRVVDWVAGP